MLKRIIIAGGGIGGLTCAIALARCAPSAEIIVHEQDASANETRGAGIQLSPNAMAILQKLQIDFTQKSLTAPEAASLYDYRGTPLVTYALGAKTRNQYGAPYIHIHRGDLHAALLRTACAAGVIIHDKSRLCPYRTEDSDLIIAADGTRSIFREKIMQAAARYSGFRAWRGMVAADSLAPLLPHVHLWMGARQHFVAYYVKGGAMLNFVAIQAHEQWTAEDWQMAGDIETLRGDFAACDTQIDAILAASESCHLWGLFDTPSLSRWYCRDAQGRHVVLLGDAAHPMPPFLAQGAAMAIEDGAVLAHILADKTRDDLDAALTQYQAYRKPRTAWMRRATYRQAHLYHAPNRLAPLRNMALRMATPFAMAQLHKIYGWQMPV